MWLILQQNKPDDFVIATGVTTTVRNFIKMAFGEIGIDVEFRGTGIHEIGVIRAIDQQKYNAILNFTGDQIKAPEIGQEVVAIDKAYFRPTEVELLIGDPTKAKTKLNWKPKYDLKSLVEEMVVSDVELFKRDIHLLKGGHKILKQAE